MPKQPGAQWFNYGPITLYETSGSASSAAPTMFPLLPDDLADDVLSCADVRTLLCASGISRSWRARVPAHLGAVDRAGELWCCLNSQNRRSGLSGAAKRRARV